MDLSGIWMVDLCPVGKQSGIQIVVWNPDWKKPVGQPSYVTLPFKYRTPILSGIHLNLVFRIQMVTVRKSESSAPIAYRVNRAKK